MFLPYDPSLHPALHDIFNLYLYPDITYQLGQAHDFGFSGATIVLERTGNMHSSPKGAVTYRYCLDGDGFCVCALAVWSDEGEATAAVELLAIEPCDDEAREAFGSWLQAALHVNASPRTLFGLPCLQ